MLPLFLSISDVEWGWTVPISKSLRVLVVDDSAAARTMLCCLLAEHDGIEIVGTAKNGIELLEKAGSLRPDLILTDLHMPRISGLECTLRLRELMPATRFMILTDLDCPFTEEDCGQPGADFYLYKENMAERVIAAIHQLFPDLDPQKQNQPRRVNEHALLRPLLSNA